MCTSQPVATHIYRSVSNNITKANNETISEWLRWLPRRQKKFYDRHWELMIACEDLQGAFENTYQTSFNNLPNCFPGRIP